MLEGLPRLAGVLSAGDLMQLGFFVLGAGLAVPPVVAGRDLRPKDMLLYYHPCILALAGIVTAPFSEASFWLSAVALGWMAVLITVNLTLWHWRFVRGLTVMTRKSTSQVESSPVSSGQSLRDIPAPSPRPPEQAKGASLADLTALHTEWKATQGRMNATAARWCSAMAALENRKAMGSKDEQREQEQIAKEIYGELRALRRLAQNVRGRLLAMRAVVKGAGIRFSEESFADMDLPGGPDGGRLADTAAETLAAKLYRDFGAHGSHARIGIEGEFYNSNFALDRAWGWGTSSQMHGQITIQRFEQPLMSIRVIAAQNLNKDEVRRLAESPGQETDIRILVLVRSPDDAMQAEWTRTLHRTHNHFYNVDEPHVFSGVAFQPVCDYIREQLLRSLPKK